ncbi:FAD-dependent oxidoreductase, partial [Brevundimonas sp.]|uniref:FAD-dependent oxidoreductase n=1 Tax=Brevundimonas sp. TaxID=1871086 RepID=UPI002ABCB2C7
MTSAPLHSRRVLLAGLGASGLTGCAPRLYPSSGPVSPPVGFLDQRLPQLDMRPNRITRITVCLRPFRAAGPRLDVETVGDKRVVHNYGHGGSGWSLAWGSAAAARDLALEGGLRPVAVIGCGAIGLTTALQ